MSTSVIAGLLGILFVALKLVGVIDWSWWWVTFPFWIGAVLFVIGVVYIVVVAHLIERREYRARRRAMAAKADRLFGG